MREIDLTQFGRTVSYVSATDLGWGKEEMNWFPVVSSIKTVVGKRD